MLRALAVMVRRGRKRRSATSQPSGMASTPVMAKEAAE